MNYYEFGFWFSRTFSDMRWNCGFGSFGFRVEFDHVDQNLGLVIWF